MKLAKLLLPLFFIISTINDGNSAFNGMDNSMNFLRQNSIKYSTSKGGTSNIPTGGQDLEDYEREISSKDLLQQARYKVQQKQKEKFLKGKQRKEQDRAEKEKYRRAEMDRQRQVEQERYQPAKRGRDRKAEGEKRGKKKREKEEKAKRKRESRDRMFNSTVNALSTIFVNTSIASDIINMVRPTISREIGGKINEKLKDVFGSTQQQQKQNATVETTWGEQKDITAEVMATDQPIAPVAVASNAESTGMELESGNATVNGSTTNSEQAEIVEEQTEINTETNEETGGQAGEKVWNTESDATIEEANNNEPITEGPSADNENVEKLEAKENQSDGEKYEESETNEESIPTLEQDSMQVETSIQN